jgi:hypothetical protein
MVVFQDVSGLPRDQFVNTFHFRSDTLDEGVVAKIRDKLVRFYNTGHTPYNAVCSYISTVVDRNQPVKVKCYDLGDAKPRPVQEGAFTLGGSAATGILPNEVALTLSYYHHRNLKRERGRIYIGPLDYSVMAGGSADRPVKDDAANAVVAAAAELALDVADGIAWGVFSDVEQTLRYPIGHAWCDNALDTIRKRGTKASSRKRFDV